MSWTSVATTAGIVGLAVLPLTVVRSPSPDATRGPPPVTADQTSPTSGGGPRWAWPVDPRPTVARPFDAPRSRWGPGHRGIDLEASPGQRVTAVADGVVTHRGRVAGRGTVTVSHLDGLRSTYEPVSSDLAKGARVARGEPIGTVGSEPGHCAPATCLHVGALRSRDYLDPRPLFGGARVILLPVPRH